MNRFTALLVAILPLLCCVSSELSGFTTSSSQFTFDFYKRAFNPEENAVLSPISIHSSLSMFYQVAGNDISADMQEHLHLPSDKAVAATDLTSFLTNVNKNSADALKVRSKMYHVQAELNPDVVSLFRDRFEAEVEVVDFHQEEEVIKSVNEWVDGATGGLIKEFMEEGDLRVDNDLLLLNVIALNATWEVPFDPQDTERSEFHFHNGVHEVDMMHLDGEFPFAMVRQYNCYAVELFYKQDTDLSMILLLPVKQHPLESIIQAMNLEMYEALDAAFYETRVAVAIPRFSMKKKCDAKELLKQMGLESLFEKFDLSLLMRDKSRIGEVRQTAFIKVDESGTEASAATEVQAVGRSGYPTFHANRPFVYLIRKRSTKDIIFIGHYSTYEE